MSAREAEEELTAVVDMKVSVLVLDIREKSAKASVLSRKFGGI
jgi:hypothetical protein